MADRNDILFLQNDLIYRRQHVTFSIVKRVKCRASDPYIMSSNTAWTFVVTFLVEILNIILFIFYPQAAFFSACLTNVQFFIIISFRIK